MNLRDEMTRSQDWIFCYVGARCMPSLANNLDGESIRGRQPLLLVKSNLPHGQKWKDVSTKNGIHLGVLQSPLFGHHPASCSSLLCRLKNPLDVALDTSFQRRKIPCHSQENRTMCVVH